MAKRSKKYRQALERIEEGRLYDPQAAFEIAKETATTNFDATIEMHMLLGVDPRQAEQAVRGTVVLPAGLGKEQRILVFAQGEKVREAEEAGANFVGGAELAKKIEGGWLDFDVAIAAPDMMSAVGRLGRILGPRGLMPNNRAGTVTFEVGRAVGEAKAGRVEFRVDRTANLHVPMGKASFTVENLLTNLTALYSAVMQAKPENNKGTFIRSIHLCATMGPSIKIDPALMQQLLAAAA
jgi:large subunit ribosomal protein L1